MNLKKFLNDDIINEIRSYINLDDETNRYLFDQLPSSCNYKEITLSKNYMLKYVKNFIEIECWQGNVRGIENILFGIFYERLGKPNFNKYCKIMRRFKITPWGYV